MTRTAGMVARRFLLLAPAFLFLRAAAGEDRLFPGEVSFPIDFAVAASGEESTAVQTPGAGEAPLAPGPDRPPAETPPPQEPERWSSFLPLMKEEALARGYQLPLPFGVGATATLLTGRDIEVTDLRIGVNGGPKRSVSNFVDLGSESNVLNTNLKLDAWLLPFLNVYGLLGYVYNESKTNLHVSIPKPGPPPGTNDFDMDVDTKLDGFVGGAGLSLAAGYMDFFAVLDSNYSQTDIGFDDSFRAITASLRAGYQAKLGALPVQVWLGGSYWNTANVAKGHTQVPGVGRIDFEADQGPKFPWLMDVGANFSVSRRFECFADLGFDFHGGLIAIIGPVVRF